MSREKELAKNTIILTIGKVCTQFINFLLLPLYTSLLSPAEYGTVDLLNTYIALLVPLFNLQFENGLFRFLLDCRGNFKRQRRIFSTVWLSNLVQVSLYIAFYLALTNFVHLKYGNYLAVSVALTILLNTLLQFPRGLGNNVAYAIGSFVSAASTVVLNAIFLAIFKLGIFGMFYATVLSQVITILYLFISQHAWKYISLKAFDKSVLKEVSKYSVPLVPNQLSWWVLGASDRTVLTHFINSAANGVYSVANKFSSIFSTFYNIFNLSWTESVSLHLKEEDSDEFLAEVINMMFNLFAAVCFGIISFMPFIFKFLVGSKYNDAYNQIPILMVAVLFQIVVGLYSVIYIALKKSKEVAKTSLYAAIINLVIDLFFVKPIGIYAASLSTLVAFAIMAIYRYHHVKRFVNINIKRQYMVWALAVGLISTFAYYYNHLTTNVLALILVAIYALIVNKSFLLEIWISVKCKIHRQE